MLEDRKREEESSWMSERTVCDYTCRPSRCLLARAKAEAYSDILSALGYTIGFGWLLLGREGTTDRKWIRSGYLTEVPSVNAR